jgi:hypothetical protein
MRRCGIFNEEVKHSASRKPRWRLRPDGQYHKGRFSLELWCVSRNGLPALWRLRLGSARFDWDIYGNKPSEFGPKADLLVLIVALVANARPK